MTKTRMLYFGYGNNMLKENIRERVGDRVADEGYRGIGRLMDHRLVFDVEVPGWKKKGKTGNASSVEAAPSGAKFCVYGVVYEYSQNELKDLDKYESHLAPGNPDNLYDRKFLSVEILSKNGDTSTEECLVYTANTERDNYPGHGLPEKEYIKNLCLGAKDHGLPAQYISMLHMYKTRRELAGDNPQLPARENTRSIDRVFKNSGGNDISAHRSSGLPLVFLSPADYNSLGRPDFVAVEWGRKLCLAEAAVHNTPIAFGQPLTLLDQTLRKTLDLACQEPAAEFFGITIRIHAINAPKFGRGRTRFAIPKLILPKPILSPTRYQNTGDYEKNIVVTDDVLTRHAGITSGDFGTCAAVIPVNKNDDGTSPLMIKSSKFRIFSRPPGSSEFSIGGGPIPEGSQYPSPNFAHLDADGRRRLNMPENYEEGYPIILRASVSKFVISHILRYGVALSVALLAIPATTKLFTDNRFAISISVAAAVVFALLLLYADIRSRIHFSKHNG